MSKEPPHRYLLHVDCQGADVEVRLNDIPILERTRGHPLTCNLPANLHLFEGENVLQARFSPPAGLPAIPQTAEIRLTLRRREKDQPEEALKDITTLYYKPADMPPPAPKEAAKHGEDEPLEDNPPTKASSPAGSLDATTLDASPGGTIKIGDPTHSWDSEKLEGTAERTIELPAGLPAASWRDADELKPDDETFMALYGEYQRLWKLLDTRDTEAVISFFRPKIDAIAAAYGYTEAEAIDAIKVVNMMRDDSIQLQPLWNRDLDIEIFGNGRLARIVDEDGDSPLYFQEKDGSLDHYVRLLFLLQKRSFSASL